MCVYANDQVLTTSTAERGINWLIRTYGQGVVTPISTVYLELRPAIVTPYTADVGVAYRITPYTTKKSHSHGGFLRRSQGHQQFSSAVTRSQAVFGRSQIVTPVAALSTAHIGVTTPWRSSGWVGHFLSQGRARGPHPICTCLQATATVWTSRKHVALPLWVTCWRGY